MYVCICQAITDRQIKSAVESGVDSVEALRDTLGVASCCGSCSEDAEKILAEHRRRPAPSPGIYRPQNAGSAQLSSA
ncbi:MAG: (2Fe-2S)-binding protein [Pseudomonadota bacterium]